MLESRCLQVKKREGNDLIVEEVLGRPEVPHWYAYGEVVLAVELAKRIYLYRSQASEALREGIEAWEHFITHESVLPASARRPTVGIPSRPGTAKCGTKLGDAPG